MISHSKHLLEHAKIVGAQRLDGCLCPTLEDGLDGRRGHAVASLEGLQTLASRIARLDVGPLIGGNSRARLRVAFGGASGCGEQERDDTCEKPVASAKSHCGLVIQDNERREVGLSRHGCKPIVVDDDLLEQDAGELIALGRSRLRLRGWCDAVAPLKAGILEHHACALLRLPSGDCVRTMGTLVLRLGLDTKTMPVPFVTPDMTLHAFNCPHCGAYAEQKRHALHYAAADGSGQASRHNSLILNCKHCSNQSIWIDALMVFPVALTAPSAHPAMPATIDSVFQEARAVTAASPRAAAALLRLCIEELADELGAPGDDLTKKVSWLVAAKGLDPGIAQVLHAVRVVGNNAVHPGQIALSGEDSGEIALALFKAVNEIVEELIARPAERQKLWELLPEAERKRATQSDF